MFPVTVVNALDVSSWELESIPQAFSRILNSWSAAVALDFFRHSITPFLRNPCSGGVLPKICSMCYESLSSPEGRGDLR